MILQFFFVQFGKQILWVVQNSDKYAQESVNKPYVRFARLYRSERSFFSFSTNEDNINVVPLLKPAQHRVLSVGALATRSAEYI